MLNSGWNSQVKKEILINFFNHQIPFLNLDVDLLIDKFVFYFNFLLMWVFELTCIYLD
jgi:hypothetical protein